MTEDMVCTRTPLVDTDSTCSGWACDFLSKKGGSLSGEDLLLSDRYANRNKRCERIKEILYRDPDSITMVTGAGISIPAGLPNWYKLVSQMLGSTLYADAGLRNNRLNSELLELYQAMMSGKLIVLNGTNTLESAEYISKVLCMQKDIAVSKPLENRMLQSLIHPMICQAKSGDKFRAEHPIPTGCTDAARYLADNTQSTLAAVAYLMQHESGFRRAMTYNYDTLLQDYMVNVFNLPESELVTHVEGLTDKPGATREVYHLHGCIPKDWDAEEVKRATYGHLSEHLILSEDSYYDVEKEGSYNWFNTIQSYYLNNSTCVFVGFSGEDYNFRRILRQLGHQKKQQHYLVVTVDDLYKDIYKNVCQYYHTGGKLSRSPEEIAKSVRLLLDQILQTREQYWGSYGFIPIWVTVKDIPEVLTSMLP